jgi:hypothetical protein
MHLLIDFFKIYIYIYKDFWGTPHQKVNTSIILNRFTQILDMDANINFYMFHGGTNWGFSNGNL